jgi:hypothetical protein
MYSIICKVLMYLIITSIFLWSVNRFIYGGEMRDDTVLSVIAAVVTYLVLSLVLRRKL